MNTIHIPGFEIGGKRTFVIAEIGSNHMQDLSLAKESIDAAAESGADAVKFQSIQLDELYHNPSPETAAFIKQLEFPEDWHYILKEYCEKRNIVFFSSPTYLKAVDLLEDVNVLLYKLASAQIGTFPQLVEKVAKLNKPTIFSTGISAYNDIIKAINIFRQNNNDKFIILHCNSIYPTPPDRVNMNLMNTYKQMFGNPVGFSDHTNGTHISCSAVAMGASVIEKHFTLDRRLNSPDSNSFASDPKEFKLLVQEIRDIESVKNKFADRLEIESEESDFKESILYRFVASKDLSKGQVINASDVKFLRSKEGINCMDTGAVIGKIINAPIKKNDIIERSFLYE